MQNITHARAISLFDYDAATGKLKWKIDRGVAKAGSEAGTVNQDGYKVCKVDCKQYKVHRIIWLMQYGEFPAEQIDHIDGNPLNNRIANLRACSNQVNQQNRKPGKNNKSGHVGVYFDGKSKWCAQIKHNGVSILIGAYDTLAAASEAYRARKAELHSVAPIVPDAERIKQWRMTRRLTQEEAGELFGVERSTYARWEANRTNRFMRTIRNKIVNVIPDF